MCGTAWLLAARVLLLCPRARESSSTCSGGSWKCCFPLPGDGVGMPASHSNEAPKLCQNFLLISIYCVCVSRSLKSLENVTGFWGFLRRHLRILERWNPRMIWVQKTSKAHPIPPRFYLLFSVFLFFFSFFFPPSTASYVHRKANNHSRGFSNTAHLK